MSTRHGSRRAIPDKDEAITASEVLAFGRNMLKECHLEGLVHGSISKEVRYLASRSHASLIGLQHALEAVKDLREALDSSEAEDSARPYTHLLPAGTNRVLQLEVINEEEINSSLLNYYSIGETQDRTKSVLLDLLVKLLSQPCFDELRTKKQLGYSVELSELCSKGAMALCINIESESAPAHLDEEVELFLEWAVRD